MRILITSNGEIEITDLANTHSRNTNMSKTFHKSNSVSSFLHNKPPFIIPTSPYKPFLSKTKSSFFSPSSSTKQVLSKATHIAIKPSKFQLTKEMFSKYYKDDNIPKETIKRMREFRHSLKLEPISDIEKAKQHYIEGNSNEISSKLTKKRFPNEIKVRDLFSVNSFKLFKNTFYKNENDKKHTCNFLSPFHFRSIYKEKNHNVNEMNCFLYKAINSDRVNLIKYFQEKEVISPLSVRNLWNYDEERMMKLNKVCQIALHEKENKKQFKEYIERKIGIKDRNVKLRSSRSLEDVTDGMKISKGILSKYNVKKDKVPFLKELVSDMNDNYWSKGNINRMYKGLPVKRNKYENEEK